jgi:hypothetical protein
VKTGAGRLTEEQADWLRIVREFGGVAVEARTFEDRRHRGERGTQVSDPADNPQETAPVKAPPAPKVDTAKLWRELALNDAAGEKRLKELGLAGADVRFSTGDSSYWWLKHQAERGWRIAMPRRTAAGDAVSFLLLSVDPRENKPSLTVKGSTIKGTALGDPLAALTAPRVYIADAPLDVLALQLLGCVVVGAQDAAALRFLKQFVGTPAGREFVLLSPEGDANRQQAIRELAFEMETELARTRILALPDAHGSLVDWLRATSRDGVLSALSAPILTAVPADGSEPATDPTSGRPLSRSYGSICRVLRAPGLRNIVLGPGELEFDEMTQAVTLARKPLLDEQVSLVRELAEKHLRDQDGEPIEFAQENVERAVFQIAREHAFHPVADYLRALAWDGNQRLHQVPSIILGAEDNDLNRAIVRRWFVSAVARPLSPGCKVDTVLVLVGPQGAGKGMFFKTLASEQWFTESVVTIGDRDSYAVLRRVWLFEWAELAHVQRAPRRRDGEELHHGHERHVPPAVRPQARAAPPDQPHRRERRQGGPVFGCRRRAPLPAHSHRAQGRPRAHGADARPAVGGGSSPLPVRRVLAPHARGEGAPRPGAPVPEVGRPVGGKGPRVHGRSPPASPRTRSSRAP